MTRSTTLGRMMQKRFSAPIQDAPKYRQTAFVRMVNAVFSADVSYKLDASTLTLAQKAANSSFDPTKARTEALRVVYNFAVTENLITNAIAKKVRMQLIALLIEQGFNPQIGRAYSKKGEVITLWRM